MSNVVRQSVRNDAIKRSLEGTENDLWICLFNDPHLVVQFATINITNLVYDPICDD